ANRAEQLQNASQVQDIVNRDLKNSVSSTNALVGQYEVLSAGFTDAAQSQQVLSSGLKLIGIGQAGGNSADPTATLQLLTKTLNAYELGAGESAKTAAVLNGIVENGLTTIQELSLGFGQTAKSAKAAGVGLVDLAGSTSVLTSQGINTANALTGIQSVNASIISKTPQAEKALAKLSLNGQKIRFDEAEVRAKGFTQALLDLNKAAGGNVKVLQEVFPEELAFRTILALLAEDGKKLESTVGKIGSTTSASLDEVFDIATGDRVNRFQKIVNRFQELIIKVAQSVAPVFEPGLDILEKIASTFANLPEPVKQAIGQFIAFQISTRASAGAVGILFQTLQTLATSYLQVRLVSLALSGQLGKEVAVMRDLIVQRKGLLSVGLQLFGVDQKYRLATEQTTKAVEKQNIITKAFAATQDKLKGVVAKNVSGFTGVQVNPEGILDKGKAAAGTAINSLKEVGRGIGEATGIIQAPTILGADGKPLSSTGLERVKNEAQKVGDAIASGFSSGKDKAVAAANDANEVIASQILGADGKPLPVKEVTNNIKQQTEKIFANVKPDKLIPKPEDALSRFTDIDGEFVKAQQRVEGAVNRELQLQKELENQVEKLSKAREKAAKSRIEAAEKADKAVFAARESNIDEATRKGLIDDAVKSQGIADRDNDSVLKAQDELFEREQRLGAAKGSRVDEQLKLSEVQEQASVKYAEAAKRETLARRFNQQAVIIEEKALRAKTLATEAEKLASLAPGDLELQAKARAARAAATTLEEKALRLKTRAEAESTAALGIATVANRTAILAEQGLTETRIFGRTVVFSTQGPLGAINKLLATEITLKGLSTAGSNALAIANTNVLGGVKSLAGALGQGVKGGLVGAFNLAKGGVSTLIGTLGPLAPLLALGGLALVAFREDLFGLRKESNAVADELNKVLQKEQEIANKFGRSQRLLQFKTEIKPGDATETVEAKLQDLRLSGDLTNSQFDQLQETLVKVADKGKLSAEALKTFEAQLDAVRQGATGKVEKGFTDNIIDSAKGIPGNIGTLFDYIVEDTTALIKNPSNYFGRDNEARADIAQNREADRLVKNLSSLDNSIAATGINSNTTLDKILDYNKALGLTTETNDKLRKGVQLTAEDFEREGLLIDEQKQRNESLISGFEQQIQKEKEVLAKVKDPENRRILEDRVNLLQSELSTLEKRNEALKQSNEQFVKYYKEILPSLKRAITESSNPQLALSNAQSAFSQQFKLDAQGKPTAFLKDINTLRNEAVQYQEQVLESFELGQFDKKGTPGAGFDEVASRLREVRDSQIKLPDGTVGNRFAVKDRIALTKQITEIQNNGSKERVSALNLESEQAKLLQLQRIKSTEDTEKEIARLQRETTVEAIKQKEIEIKEFTQFPVRKAELEREAASLRIKLSSQEAAEESRLLQQKRSRIQESFNIESEAVKTLQSQRLVSEEVAAKQLSRIQLKAANNQLQNLVEDYNKSGKTSVELEQKIALQRASIRQQEAAEESRLLQLKRNQLQQTFNIESEGIKTLQVQRLISAESAQEQLAQIQLKAANNQLQNLIEDYNKSGKTSVELEQKIALQRASIRQQEAAEAERLLQLRRNRIQENFNLELEEIKTLQAERVVTEKDAATIINQTQIAATRQQLKDLEFDFNRSGGTDIELSNKIISTRLKLRQQEATEIERVFNLEQQRQQRIIGNNAQLQSLILKGRGEGIDSQVKLLQGNSQLNQSREQFQISELNAAESAIGNKLRFTGDIEERAKLESVLAINKQKTLQLTQAQERESFEIQQRINQLQLQREEIQLRISKIENERDAGSLELELIKAKRENRTPEEITAIELQIKANSQASESLEKQNIQLTRTKLIQGEIAENSRKELDVK
ncbi:MAG: phage tail tape measure protein, partial [Richelia sp. RM2_1_2]|nr:phage tail tape measure protein [Richelia sp. RM2_1_2]